MSFSPRQYTLAATALGSSLAFIDATAVIIALPTIQKSLHFGLAGEQWVFLSYSLALASLYLIGGSLGDRYGHRQIFRIGVAGFALTSLMAGFAPSGFALIAARTLQGVAGSLVTTNSLAWLRNVYQDEAGYAVGRWTSLTSISTIAAPLLGGLLTQWISWRAIFFINLPLAALVIWWSSKATEDKPKEEKPARLDFAGAGLIAVSLGFLVYFLVEGAKKGFSDLIWALVAGLALGVTFILVELRSKSPLLPLKLFRIRNFTVANLETMLAYGALYGVLVYFTLYLQFIGLSPITSSLFSIPTSVVLILLAGYFGKMADKRGPRLLLTLGPVLVGVGALTFGLINDQSEVWLWGSVGLAIFALGLAMIVAPITAVALKSVPTNYAGIASGLNNTMSRIGSLVSVAVIGLVVSLVFFNHTANKSAVPLNFNEKNTALQQASMAGFRAATYLIAGLAFSAAIVGGVGFSVKKRS
jgi:EmrB/QacA subfamily drug resistance transporter